MAPANAPGDSDTAIRQHLLKLIREQSRGCAAWHNHREHLSEYEKEILEAAEKSMGALQQLQSSTVAAANVQR